ncbi:MAG: hypothetical protein ACYDEJ_02045 [Desulfitobacteriaceae bacterium]
MEEQVLLELQEVQDSVKCVRPDCVIRHCPHGGKGFIEDSLFIVRRHRIIWVVILFDGAVATKEVSPEWLEIFSDIITDSPSIFVEFDRCHKIVEWITFQDKVLPDGPIKKGVPKVNY